MNNLMMSCIVMFLDSGEEEKSQQVSTYPVINYESVYIE